MSSSKHRKVEKAGRSGGSFLPETVPMNARKLLLRALFHKLGGPSSVGRKLMVNPNVITNWIARGKVPLQRAVPVSRILKIYVWGLNYNDLMQVLPRPPRWKDVVLHYNFSKDLMNTLITLAD